MISPLIHCNYKEYIKDLLSQPGVVRGYQSKMAKAMNCQAAYLSQVLRGKVDLTEDHGLKLTQFLKLNDLESDYFLILLRMGRAVTKELKNYLEERRVELLTHRDDLKNKVGAKSARDTEAFLSRYFSSWIPLTLHIATSSAHFQSIEALAQRFNLDESVVKENLFFLEKYHLVERSGTQWKFSGESIHLPKTSALSEPFQVSLRTQVIKSIQHKSVNDLHFSSVFTIDKKSYSDILEICNRAIEDSHKVIHQSGTEEVYALSLDLFKVI